MSDMTSTDVGTGVAVGGMGVDVGVGRMGVAVGGTGVKVGVGGIGVAVGGTGVGGIGVAVGGTGVKVGVGGIDVAVGGTGVKVGVGGTCVLVGVGTVVGVSVGDGEGVGVMVDVAVTIFESTDAPDGLIVGGGVGVACGWEQAIEIDVRNTANRTTNADSVDWMNCLEYTVLDCMGSSVGQKHIMMHHPQVLNA